MATGASTTETRENVLAIGGMNVRETKFRAWDKHDKRMIVDEQEFIPLKVTNKGVLRLSPDHAENLWSIVEGDRFELMQYTGLKDKNGKEIYEGDIIFVPADEYEEEYKGEIKWYGGYWGFDEFYPDGTLCGSLFLFSYHDFGEVIGNIYENPELSEGHQID